MPLDHADQHRPQYVDLCDAGNPSFEIPASLMPVARRAYAILLDILTRHGNQPGVEQKEVLLHLLLLYFKMATGQLRDQDQRVVAALPTGYGKTSSVVALIVALHAFGIEDLSVTVAASKVEALAELKRELIRQAGAAILPKLGLLHAYRYDPHEVAQARAEGRQLPDGYASEPATWEDPEARQFLLVTHARMRNDGPNGSEQYNRYHGKERSLVIYDESLLPADVLSFSLARLKGGLEYLRHTMANRTDLLPVLAWLDQAHQTLTARHTHDWPDNTDGRLVSLPALPEADQQTYLRLLPRGDFAVACESCLRLAGATVRLQPTDNGLAASYSVVIPEDVKRLVVLDASYVIRDLVRDDVRTTPIEDLPGKFQALRPVFARGLKRYPRMAIRIMQANWGRTEIDKEFGIKDVTQRRFINDLVRTIKAIPADESVLVFVYKDRGRLSQRSILLSALQEAGVDTRRTVQVNGKTRLRINLSTWGSETSTNDYAHCAHVILAGVMQLPKEVLLGHYLAARDDLQHPYPTTKARDVSLTESVHLIYQAASRGACRATDEHSQAPAMTLWLTTPKPNVLRPLLQRVFPEATFHGWQGDFGKQSEAKVSKAADRVRAFLQAYEAEGHERISTRKLKALLPELQAVNPKTAQRALTEVSGMADLGWIKQGAWMVRPFGPIGS
jgi:hypothetical protein